MDATFYCEDCETPIDGDDVDTHEAKGHDVRGTIQPNRLLSQDPWERTEPNNGGKDVSGDSG